MSYGYNALLATTTLQLSFANVGVPFCSGTSTSSKGSSESAVDITLAGLSLQVFSMVAFCGLIIDYLIRYSKSGGQALAIPRLRLFLGFLGGAIILILARCAYRVAELSDGYFGDLFHDEPLFIGLEGVLIVLAVLALCIGHPGFVFLSSETGLKMHKTSGEENGIMLQNK